MGEFRTALAGEATDGLQLLMDPERAWFAARRAVAGRRRHSRAAMAVDILAAAPLVCASSLAAGLGMAVNNAAVLLEGLCAAGFAVELTHRAKRRLFGLAALTPVREVAPPRRPAAIPLADPVTERAALPERALTPVERRCHRRVNSRQIGRLKNRHLDTRAVCRLLPESGLLGRRPG